MLEIFKRYNLIDEIDPKITQDETIFVECAPNKLPFVLKYIKPYVVLEILVIFFDFLYGVLKPDEIGIFIEVFEVFLIVLNCVPLALLFRAIYMSLLKVINSYYVITDKGIHVLQGGKALDYNLYIYEDIKSIILNRHKASKNRGDIIIKDATMPSLKTFKEKFFYFHVGLIAIDDAKKVYNIMKQIALQINSNIFFSDDNGDLKIDYFRDVKKYNKKITIDKEDSIIKRRG